MELRILGPLEVVDGDRSIQLGGQKPRALLTLLILRRGDVVSIDEIVEVLWADAAPKTAEHSIQVYVSELRKALGGGVEIVTRAGGYSLQIHDDSLDVDRFARLADRGRASAASGDPRQASALLHEALAVWRGAPLPEFAYDDFARGEIDRLEELRLAALEDRIDADLELGRNAEVVSELRSLVDAHPFRERLRASLMLVLYRSGRQSEALQEFHHARTLRADELGIDPGPALVDLNAAILAQDPALARRAPAAEDAAISPPADDEPARTEPGSSPTRKIVTILFAELSAGRDRPIDPEASASIASRAFEAARATLDAHGGTIVRRDDGVLAVFGHPVAHEDDAVRAVRAAIELRDRLDRLDGELEGEGLIGVDARIGIHTGEVLTAADPEGIDPEAMRRARGIAAHADGTNPVIDAATFELARDAVDVEATGTETYRLLAVRAGALGVARRIDSPIVGRDDELAELQRAFDRVGRDRRCELLTVHGEAGIGKTRLVDEFTDVLRDRALVLEGRCLAYGEGITYWPIAEAIRAVADINDEDDATETRDKLAALLPDDADRGPIVEGIAHILGFSDAAPVPGETLRAIRRLLEALAVERPIVLLIEDIHWAEPTLLEMLEGLADWLGDTASLILCTTRPDIFERRPGWGGGRPNASMIALRPLSSADTAALIENLVRHPGLDDDAKAKLSEAAEGNPLFVEQMLSMLIDEGLLTSEGGSWTLAADLTHVALPTSLQTLLTARLDALPAAERHVLGVASVIGRTFDIETVATLATAADDITRSVVALVRKDLVRPVRTPAGDGFRFRHVLIMNATYETLPKRTRAELHERVADQLVDASGVRSAAYDEIVGDHLARAAGFLAEIGPRDEHLEEIRHRGGSRLAAAGVRAFARGDMPAAVTLHGRAVDLLPGDGPERLAVLPELGQALVEVGRSDESDLVFDEAIALGTKSGDLRTLTDALLFRFESELWRGLFDRAGASEELARRLIEQHPHDGFVQQRCWSILGIWAPTWAEQSESTQRAMDFAEEIGDAKGRNENIQMMSGLLSIGPGPAEEGLATTEDFLARAADDPVTEAAIVVNARAQLLGMTGRMDDARREYERARQTFRDLGLPLWLGASGTIGPAATENAFGDPAIAESLTREGIDALERLGGGAQSWLIQVLLIHGHSLASQNRPEEAAALLPRIAEIGHPFDEGWVTWLRGQIALVAGRPDEAVADLRAALDGIHEDWYLPRGQLTLMLAEALHDSGDLEGSRARATEALSIFERKGDTVSPERAKALL